MSFFSMEHSVAAYRCDFILYGGLIGVLGAVLAVEGPAGMRLELIVLCGAGVGVWSMVEYALHRFVLHAFQPFKYWHDEHHRRPAALICTPTLLSAALIGLWVALPALLALGPWRGGALTLGVLVGYMGYTVVHHALHHWNARTAWLLRRKRWHARHHHAGHRPCCYGVTSGFWDHVFRTTGRKGNTGSSRV